jgi:hypothetical protein
MEFTKETIGCLIGKCESQASNPDANYVVRLLTKEQQLISDLHIAFNAGKNDGSFDLADTKALDCNAFVEQVLDGKNPTFGSCTGVEPDHRGELHTETAKGSTPVGASLPSPYTTPSNN